MNPSLEKQALIAVRRMQARLEEYERRAGEPIAIVGMCCRFPGANDIEEYWRLLRGVRLESEEAAVFFFCCHNPCV